MNYIFLFAFVFAVAIFAFFMVTFKRQNGAGNSQSKKLINKFNPDNLAPELSKMIEYHKENGAIHYEI